MESGERSTFIFEWASGTRPYYLNSLESSEAAVHFSTFDRLMMALISFIS
jgi:hypothetical protein